MWTPFDPAAAPRYTDFAGRDAPPVLGTMTLSVHVVLSWSPESEPIPTVIEGEQQIEFNVMAECTPIVGRTTLHPRAPIVFITVLSLLLDPAVNVHFKALGWINTPSARTARLNGSATDTTAQAPLPVPGDEDPDAFSDEPVDGYVPASIDQIKTWPLVTKIAVPSLADELATFLFQHQASLFGQLLPAGRPALPFINHVLKPGARPIKSGHFRRPAAHIYAKAIAAHDKLELNNVTERVTDPSTLINILPHVYPLKANRVDVRCTLDCTEINDQILRVPTTLPDTRHHFQPLLGCQVFSDLDFRLMFHSAQYYNQTANLFGFLRPDGIYCALANTHVTNPLREVFAQLKSSRPSKPTTSPQQYSGSQVQARGSRHATHGHAP